MDLIELEPSAAPEKGTHVPEPLPPLDHEPSHEESVSHVEADPGYAPAPFVQRHGWLPAVGVLGSVVCAGTLMSLTAQRNPLLDVAANPAPPAEVSPADGLEPDRMASARPLELAGPPRPQPAPGQPAAEAPTAIASAAVEGSAAATGRPRGRIGFLGSIAGPLNTDLSGVGPVRGPIWTGAPLPAIGAAGSLAQASPIPTVPGAPSAPVTGGEVGSELPDATKLALARLANPLLSSVRPASSQPAPQPAASAERPLSASLSVARPARGYEPSATVAVRGSASTDAYFILIGVDADGRASTLFRSPSRVRSFGYAIRAQAGAGPQYLALVASLEPPTGADVAAALRAGGQGFVSPTVVILSEAAQPGAAWSAAVSQAAGLGGGAKGWKRHEWAVATASFFTRAPAKVAVEKRAPEKAVAPKPEAGDGSVIPGAAKPEMQPGGEKSAMPVVKPEPAQPKTPAAPAETPKPAAKPETAPEKGEMEPITAPK